MISNEDAQKIIDQYHGQKYDDPNLGGEFHGKLSFPTLKKNTKGHHQ